MPSPLTHSHLIALRGSRELSALRRSLSVEGARLHCVAPWRIQAAVVEPPLLARCLAQPQVVFTSPNAVRFAAALARLADIRGQVLAVGAGTAKALSRHGVHGVAYPAEMRSEGLLSLPALRTASGVGLVSGVGGRGLIAAALQLRGTPVLRCDVYRRCPLPLAPATRRRLQALPAPVILLLSSAEALEWLCRQSGGSLPDRDWWLLAASARLAELAQAAGCTAEKCLEATSARPRDLLRALRDHAKAGAFR